MPFLLSLFRLAGRIRNRVYTTCVAKTFQGFGDRSVITPPARLVGTHRIHIGRNVTIGSNCWLHVLKDSSNSSSPAIQIGDGCSFAGFCTVTAAQSVIIEPNVLIARYVYISDHGHSYTDYSLPIKDQGITTPANVRVREGAWLGQGVIICPGVTIGRNAVIGANSVVKADVPDHHVAVGAPARIIRSIKERPR